MQRRHLGDAVAVILVGGTQGHIAAGNMGDGNMPGCRRGSQGKNLKPVPQQQHGVRAVGSKPSVKDFQCPGNGLGYRFLVFLENRQPCRDGQSVRFNLPHRFPQPGAQVGAGHHQLQPQPVIRRQLLRNGTQKAIFRPGGRYHANGTHTGSFPHRAAAKFAAAAVLQFDFFVFFKVPRGRFAQHIVPAHGADAVAGAFGGQVVGGEHFTGLDGACRNNTLAGN